MKDKFYITTPIYYPSGNWHLGTCYTTVICDALARFKRMQGADVFYLTGTDEHGQKIEKAAATAGISPKAYVDKQVSTLKNVWSTLNISYDKFIRTTDKEHEEAVSKIFAKLYEKGDIYKSEYEGWYCVPCESFWTKTQLVDGKCPDCGREVELTKESSYFFRLSKYQDRLIKLIEDNPEFLQPRSRQNEMLNNFLKPGLQDLCVSRSSFKWGIPVPFDKEHVIYVWIDALSNYITALGYLSGDDSLMKKFWPADIHMMGKEIVRFHSIIWPAILMALDLPLPKRVYGHGWLVMDGGKMSKSKGNIADPIELCRRYGSDAIRYYLLREIPFGQDGNYSNSALLTRINSDLVNDFGNLVSRTAAMIEQYCDGVMPERPFSNEPHDVELQTVAKQLYGKVAAAMGGLDAPTALIEIWKLFERANKYIDATAPWTLNKAGDKARLADVLYNLAEAIRIGTVLLQPFLTDTPNKVFEMFGVGDSLKSFDSIKTFGGFIGGEKVSKNAHLFARIDIQKELADMDKYTEQQNAGKLSAESAPEGVQKVEEITIDDFAKIQLKVAKVVAVERVIKADKLLKLTLDAGGVERTVVSGIAKYYEPEQLVGCDVVIVANLKPVKLRGILSEGMILCAESDDGQLSVISPSAPIKSGSGVR